MKDTIELFSGTKSFSKEALNHRYMIFTIDNQLDLYPDLCSDILLIDNKDPCFRNKFILWASPPCTSFSVAAISRNWILKDKIYIPKSDNSLKGLALLDKTISLIKDTDPFLWFIENPRGMMRKVIDEIFKRYDIKDYRLVTISYCQYGDNRMKPTDIWTNFSGWQPKSICKNGSDCHISSPRGSRTGTQGLKNAKERGIIPPNLFKEIFKQIQDNLIKCPKCDTLNFLIESEGINEKIGHYPIGRCFVCSNQKNEKELGL